jgi:hypothetical protein
MEKFRSDTAPFIIKDKTEKALTPLLNITIQIHEYYTSKTEK